MFSRATVSWKVAGVVMIACLALGVMLGLVVPTAHEAVAEPLADNKLRGAMDRRLAVVGGEEKAKPATVVPPAEITPPSRSHVTKGELTAVLPSQTLAWPEDTSKDQEVAGGGLWGSDEDFWGATEKMWAKNEIEKVWGLTGFAEEEDDFEGSYWMATTNAFSYMWDPITSDLSYDFDPITSGYSY